MVRNLAANLVIIVNYRDSILIYYGVAFHTGQRTCGLLAKTVHWTVSLRSALARAFRSARHLLHPRPKAKLTEGNR
jgi:hypothetical protein